MTRRLQPLTLALVDSLRKSHRFEVGIGQPDGESFGPGQIPGAMTTAGGIARQLRANAQCYQRRLATTWCFPLPPQSSSQPHPDPAGKVSQYLRRLTEAEIASPTPHIRGQLRYRRLDADALGPSCDLSYASLESLQSLRRNRALHLRTVREAEAEKFRASGRATALLASLTLSLSLCVMNREMLSITRFPARSLRT